MNTDKAKDFELMLAVGWSGTRRIRVHPCLSVFKNFHETV